MTFSDEIQHLSAVADAVHQTVRKERLDARRNVTLLLVLFALFFVGAVDGLLSSGSSWWDWVGAGVYALAMWAYWLKRRELTRKLRSMDGMS